MLPIIVLFSSLAFVSATEGGIDIPIPLGDAAVDTVPLTLHFNFPAMSNLSEQAKKDFADILFNQDITKTEMENHIRSWGANNGILDAVNLEMTKDDQRTKDLRVNITKAIAEFPAAFAKYTAIEDNKSLTINQANEETEALLDTIKTPYLKRFIYAVSYPDYAEGEEPLFTINAAKQCPHSSSYRPSFFNSPPFEKASADAKTEFSNIISVRLSFISREIIDCFQNESLTKGQLETEIKSWAAKNNATDAVNAAQVKDQEFTRSLRGNITKAVNELPALITKSTMEQTKERIETELKGISTPYLREMIEAIGEKIEEDEKSQSTFNLSLGR
ncbi:hypothetical protein PRIPAC_80980 [Pristionchus pacificus]|uniref:Uncharacterized protein n=1 Tax=Pristionchus pacificus TaxID=54126 RepID=A0A2A6C4P2_PRIPA|nr:hypothetical protein PRIPAC_80980 [Pristionchus pacificus]|eukprot:PDM73086.1 hypothetical protein PRIPAC_39520 [Pristionchus pacificus]